MIIYLNQKSFIILDCLSQLFLLLDVGFIYSCMCLDFALLYLCTLCDIFP